MRRRSLPLTKGELEGVMPKRGSTAGFTLIESVMVIVIISMMSALALQSLPIARSNQQLIADTEQIRALMLDAKERALNQVRPSTCLPGDDSASVDRAACSDVGIAFSGNKVIEFADTNLDNLYDASDYVIVTFDLTSAPGTGSTSSFLFKSEPPSTIMYANGIIMAPGDTGTIILNGYGSLSRTLIVRPYGTIDVQ